MRTLLISLMILGMQVKSFGSTVTINIDADLLKTASGQAMPATGLVILVANTNNTAFSQPTSQAFVSGGDVIVARWDLSAFGTAGVLLDTASFGLSGALTTGDPLQLYWFPTLTLSSTAPGPGTAYGQYRDAVGIDGSAPWVVPGAGATVDLSFRTADADAGFDSPGSSPASAGLASNDILLTGSGVPIAVGETPLLGIARGEEGIALSWPDPLGQWQLQASGTLDGGWAGVPTAPTLAGGVRTVTVSGADAVKFFRLQAAPVAALDAQPQPATGTGTATTVTLPTNETVSPSSP